MRYLRKIQVAVGQAGALGQSWEDSLDISFSIKKSGKKKPNTLALSVWNLGHASRGVLEADDLVCVLQTAHGGEGLSKIFLGDVRDVEHITVEGDVRTDISVGDGSRAYTLGAVSKSFAAKSTSQQVLEAVAHQLGMRALFIADLGDVVYENGYVAYGLAREVLDELAEGLGGEWSIQDGELQVVQRDQGTNARALLVTPQTGLIGSPARVKKAGRAARRSTGVKFRVFLAPALRPGGYVKLETQQFSGFYLIRNVAHHASNHELPWYTDVTATLGEPQNVSRAQGQATASLHTLDEDILAELDAAITLWDRSTNWGGLTH